MIEALLSFVVATCVLALSPGPDNMYVLSQSLVNGSKSALATTAGLISGCIVHTTLLAFGFSAVITTNPSLFFGIKVVGALYLLYLAYAVFKSDATLEFSQNAPKKSSSQLFKQGVLMNLLNPKVMLFFLALFPQFLWQPQTDTVLQFYILGITFMVVSFIVFATIALLAGRVSAFLNKKKHTGVFLKWLQILVFLAIAAFILVP
ncbi:MAG TPA: lysine transporter LysE [Flavobacteriaceae bacterium]|nr:LysE family translocator [Ulvibacter sp.]CAI8334844.1 MAG: Homoserine/homoserine lactone efflux protein [Flavobacteriaceae bacterium]HAH33946.1 lysine transporter LysE [Flavobacteriaceae bacterium]|tara:strand:- start:2968 stop:3582 length:615 start_codon:yes stop_codon:yes gene_type:complete